MTNILKNFNHKKIIILYLILSAILTTFILGVENLNPINENWLYKSDRAHDLIVWKYFYNDEWKFPIGLNENFGLEISNSIAFSGSPPLFSLIFKVLKPILPINFNYFSILIFINIFLQGLLAYLIILNLTNNKSYSIISSFLFILSPIFLFKFGYHLSLTAHWIILSYLYIEISQKEKIKKKLTLLVLLISSLVHFYFTLIILIMIFLSLLIELNKRRQYILFFKDSFFYIISLVILMYIIGYFTLPLHNTLGGGYGMFNINILSFFNPFLEGVNWSNFLPTIYKNKSSEDFAYLGMGILLLCIIIINYWFKNYKKLKIEIYQKFILIFVTLFILSVSNNISFGNTTLFEFELNKYIYGVLSLIRASGRLVWPCVYLLLIFGIYSVYEKKNIKKSIIIIITILIIQIADLQARLTDISFGKIYVNDTKKLNDERWNQLNNEIKIFSGINIYNEINDFENLVVYLSKYLPLTELSYLARVDRKKQANLTYQNIQNITKKKINLNKTFYLQTMGHLNHVSKIYKNQGFDFIRLDELWFFIPHKRNLMKNHEVIFIEKLAGLNKTKKNYILNNFKTIKKDESIGLGWIFDRKTRKLYSDGSQSFLLFNDNKKFKGMKLKLNISNVLSNYPNNNLITLKINEEKYMSFEFNINQNDKEIVINLEDLNLENFILSFVFSDPKSKFDYNIGIDEKKRGITLNSYVLEDI